VLQFVAVRCSVLQCRDVLQRSGVCVCIGSKLQCVAVCCMCCSVLQCVAVCCMCCSVLHTHTHTNTSSLIKLVCNTLQHTATHCNTLQHTATHCNTLQHTATHCNTVQLDTGPPQPLHNAPRVCVFVSFSLYHFILSHTAQTNCITVPLVTPAHRAACVCICMCVCDNCSTYVCMCVCVSVCVCV